METRRRRTAERQPGRVDLLRYVDAPLSLAVLVLGGTGVALAGPGRLRLRLGLVTCAGVVLVLALSGGRPGRRALNLVPLRTVVEEAHNPDVRLLVVNLVGNVVCFVPLGALLSAVLRRGTLAATAAGTAFCAVVEAVQYGLGRTADVDDVLLNGFGVALGALAVVRWYGTARRRDRVPAASSGGAGQVTASTTP